MRIKYSVRKNINFLANIATIIALFAAIIAFFLAKNAYDAAKDQTILFQNQVFLLNTKAIIDLGDRCMWNPTGGDRFTFELLKSRQDPEKGIKGKKLQKAIANQINRVKQHYKSTCF